MFNFNLHLDKCMFICNSSKKSNKSNIDDIIEKLKNNLNANNPKLMIEFILKEIILCTNCEYAFINKLQKNQDGVIEYTNVAVSNLDMTKNLFVKSFQNLIIKYRGQIVGCIGIGSAKQKLNGIYQPIIDLLGEYINEL